MVSILLQSYTEASLWQEDTEGLQPHALCQGKLRCLISVLLSKVPAVFVKGGFDPGTNPQLYLSSIFRLTKWWNAHNCTKQDAPPLIVNTCGWVTGLGLDLLAQITVMLQPTHGEVVICLFLLADSQATVSFSCVKWVCCLLVAVVVECYCYKQEMWQARDTRILKVWKT